MSCDRALLLLLLLAVAPLTAEAQPSPYKRYRTLDTEHFHVHVPVGLELEGRVAGAAAERAYGQLAKELRPPRGPIDLVVTDDADYSNGYATPIPNNRIVVFATPPVESNSLRLNEDWLALVITHELTHIFHLDRADGLWGVAQHIFGRAPGLFPNSYGPSWLTEGLAVYYESRLTPGGRLKDAEHKMFARSAALENRLPQLNELSLGSAIFPGGTIAYAYGSLFVDYLSRARGDTTIAHLVDAQSRQLIPWRMNHASSSAFGISFDDAFRAWRDSVQRTVGAATAPLDGWRELTHHGYYAQDPRWLNDSTLVYASNDGRTTSAEYILGLNGDRSRLGRRNSLGPNIPLANGGLLFAQLEFTSPSEVRSDLYVERGGKQRRLTKGQRLVQPDVRKDGTIVAVQLAATRTRLILLDSNGRAQRRLRDGSSDETWSDPRWSPDGNLIAAVHRAHGGSFTLEIIDYATGESRVVERGPWLISSPAWSANSGAVYYVSEEFGIPSLMRATAVAGGRVPMQRVGEGNGIFSPDVSPSGNQLAAVTLRADGYHVGVAGELRPAGPILRPPADAPVIESEHLAAGEYHRYSPWRSALPMYWNPILEDAPNGGLRLGATTSGHDVISRHIYELSAATTTKGTYPTASLVYRYAGLRRPLFDFAISQDYTREASLKNGGTTDVVGNLLRRTQSTSLGGTFVHARVRTYASLSFGGGVERRKFMTDPVGLLKQLDPSFAREYQYPSVYLAGQWGNTQRPTLSISAEDGVSLAFTARGRTRSDSVSERASASVIGTAALFKSLDLPGYAHHVIALRLAGGYADRRAASSLSVGGTSGGTIQIIPTYTVGEGRRTFGVRGFESGSVFGTRAATATLEYRAPLGLGGRGIGSLPFFFDRSSVSAFVDAGIAGCGAAPLNPGVCAPSRFLDQAIASTGAELVLSAAIFDWDAPQKLRAGFAVPVAGRALVGAKRVSVYAAYGLSF
ncbi:MAG: hypothetical protein ABIT20_00215 [Gemmatimonadaceae bacterium]